MALITCPDCQAAISDAAPSCPRCGRPFAYAAPTAARPQVVVARRAGAPYEMGGFAGMALGTVVLMPSCVTQSGVGVALGVILGGAGFMVFMVGRFID